MHAGGLRTVLARAALRYVAGDSLWGGGSYDGRSHGHRIGDDLLSNIVIHGVMEHLPGYPAALRQLQRLLGQGGRVYLDASAFREKYVKPAFISPYVFPGDHSYFCLHDFPGAVAKTSLDVLAVHNDRHSYYLTCKVWAENLEAARAEISRRWGDELYRRFRLYLWGSAYAFLDRGMEAYRVVLEKPREG
jgi:cyclopropane-fatty-acyl-phospholipid synthase